MRCLLASARAGVPGSSGLDSCPARVLPSSLLPRQALHVAVQRHSLEAISLLLEAGAPPDAKSTRRWMPLDEAVALRDKEAACLLLTCACCCVTPGACLGCPCRRPERAACHERFCTLAPAPAGPVRSKLKTDAKAEMKERKRQLVATMAQLHDFTMKVGWEGGKRSI